jgi:DNA-binding NarL/FixJ family response regulator
VQLFVLDPHTIYRRGLVACLELMPEVQHVGHAGTLAQARQDPALAHAELVQGALQAGAVGYLRKDTLTTETLGAAVRAAANGTGVMEPDLLGNLLRGVSLDHGRPAVAFAVREGLI